MRFFCFFILSFVACVLSYAQNNEWLNHFGGTNSDNIRMITYSQSGKLLAIGTISDSVTFKKGSYDSTFYGINGNNLILQLNPLDGSINWVKQFGKGGSHLNSMAIDIAKNNTIAIVGSYYGEPDFDPDTGIVHNDSLNYPGLFALKLDSNGNYIWVKTIKNTTWINSVAHDDNSNIYFTGSYWRTVDFDPGNNIKHLVTLNPPDGYLCSLDSNGNFRFVRNFRGGGHTNCSNVKYDDNGFLYILGNFQSNLIAKPNQRRINGKGGTDIYLTKMDTSGVSTWTRHIGGGYGEYGVLMELDYSGNIYISGLYKDSIDMDPTNAKYYLKGNGNQIQNFFDIFIAKYNSQGYFLWAKGFGGIGYEYIYAAALDSDNNVYISGIFSDTADFDPSTKLNRLIPNGNNDIFISKFDSLGDYQFTIQYEGQGTGAINSLETDNHDNLICAGYFIDSVDFDPGIAKLYKTTAQFGSDLFIQKLNQNSIAVKLFSNPKVISQKVHAFPNPTKGSFSIQLNEEYITALVKIRDLTGQLISRKEYSPSNQINLEINREKGLYLVELVIDGQDPIYLKIIKQ